MESALELWSEDMTQLAPRCELAHLPTAREKSVGREAGFLTRLLVGLLTKGTKARSGCESLHKDLERCVEHE